MKNLKMERVTENRKGAAWKAFCSLRHIYSDAYGLIEKKGTAREFIEEAYMKMGYHLEAFSVASAEEVTNYISRLICTDPRVKVQFDLLGAISEFYYTIVENEKYRENALISEEKLTAMYREIRNRVETRSLGIARSDMNVR